METVHHLELPRGLQVDFAQKVQAITDARGDELTADELLAAFREHYLSRTTGRTRSCRTRTGRPRRIGSSRRSRSTASRTEVTGVGNGPIAALVDAFEKNFGISIRVRDYHEHAMAASADATAAAYVEADVDDDPTWGVGLHPSIATASLRAVVNAVNRALAARAGGGHGERPLRRRALGTRRSYLNGPRPLARRLRDQRQDQARSQG